VRESFSLPFILKKIQDHAHSSESVGVQKMNAEQWIASATARVKTDPGQEMLESISPTPPPQQSEDEVGGKTGQDEKPQGHRINIKLRLSPQNQGKIDLMTKKEETADILLKMKQESDEGANTKLEDIPSFQGKFKEELDLVDEKGFINAKVECKEEFGSPDVPPNDQLVVAKIEEDNVLGSRSIASSLSPYCQIMENPSWETSEVYHR
jgi:hypothetical protein